jgi:co-chaperonin GroES (HSP10)
MQLMNDNVLVEPFNTEDEVTEGGILIPSRGAHTTRARVIDVGPGARIEGHPFGRTFMKVRRGDEVVLPRNTGTPIIIEKKQSLIIKEDEILMFFRPEEPEEKPEEKPEEQS